MKEELGFQTSIYFSSESITSVSQEQMKSILIPRITLCLDNFANVRKMNATNSVSNIFRIKRHKHAFFYILQEVLSKYDSQSRFYYMREKDIMPGGMILI